jgi:hypothetical protein
MHSWTLMLLPMLSQCTALGLAGVLVGDMSRCQTGLRGCMVQVLEEGREALRGCSWSNTSSQVAPSLQTSKLWRHIPKLEAWRGCATNAWPLHN